MDIKIKYSYGAAQMVLSDLVLPELILPDLVLADLKLPDVNSECNIRGGELDFETFFRLF